ncbi:hypothetical protein [Paraburkholderia aspalathi]|uniref:hypothetical protein n=1 Tax=Paraburkholderia aspalathi TaxID=1324617 RepID=UPI0038B98A94
MKIVLAPNPTGSGHNMRAFALAKAMRHRAPDTELIVLLASLQTTFTPLFDSIGVIVIDIAGEHVDHATKSNLNRRLDWATYIGGYISSSFLNAERLLKYIALYQELEPDFVISDKPCTVDYRDAVCTDYRAL